jgi:hypothetical protein
MTIKLGFVLVIMVWIAIMFLALFAWPLILGVWVFAGPSAVLMPVGGLFTLGMILAWKLGTKE